MFAFSQEPDHQDRVWFQRLNQSPVAGHPPETVEEAIAWFSGKPQVPRYLMRAEESFGLRRVPKSMWLARLAALAPFLPDVEVTMFFAEHLGDPNWKGWSMARSSLLACGDHIVPQLELTKQRHHQDIELHHHIDELIDELRLGRGL